ncbi:hypothetical protein HPB51_013079 [Rhipicephalus microplus]|uniref:Uncharacterized protein n=1 Tax=Rhipicephalus microplus TaxID=6941 RepID=A0A9J6F3Y2_RHIMP|nr:hypothetical protein HPB51_013079 [Rhipicephalus microplus]
MTAEPMPAGAMTAAAAIQPAIDYAPRASGSQHPQFARFGDTQPPKKFLDRLETFCLVTGVTANKRFTHIMPAALEESANLWLCFLKSFESWEDFKGGSTQMLWLGMRGDISRVLRTLWEPVGDKTEDKEHTEPPEAAHHALVAELRQCLGEALKYTKKHQAAACQTERSTSDHHQQSTTIREGDLVLLDTHTLSNTAKGVSAK